jgi:hypothetical protein
MQAIGYKELYLYLEGSIPLPTQLLLSSKKQGITEKTAYMVRSMESVIWIEPGDCDTVIRTITNL